MSEMPKPILIPDVKQEAVALSIHRRPTVLLEDSLRDEDHTDAGNVSSSSAFAISPNVSDILASDSPVSSGEKTVLGKRPHPVDIDCRSNRHPLIPILNEFFESHAMLLDQALEMSLSEGSPQRSSTPFTGGNNRFNDLSGFSMMANASEGSHSTGSPVPNKEKGSAIEELQKIIDFIVEADVQLLSLESKRRKIESERNDLENRTFDTAVQMLHGVMELVKKEGGKPNRPQ